MKRTQKHRRAIPKRKRVITPTFTLDDDLHKRTLFAEAESRRLRDLIDQHEKEAEARYSGRAKNAEANTAQAVYQAQRIERSYNELIAAVKRAFEDSPVIALYELVRDRDD